MSLNNTSQQDEAVLPLPALPPPMAAPPAVEQPVQPEEFSAAAPQADSLSSPSPAPELIQPLPPPPHEPHPSGLPGPEPKVLAVAAFGPGLAPACLYLPVYRTCFPLALCMTRPHRVPTEPTVCLWLPHHCSRLGDQKHWYIGFFDQDEDIQP